MRIRKAYLLIFVVVFVLMLVVPILTINRIPGRISETENRHLATFPDVFDDAGDLNDGVKSGVETWLGDNIGFRSGLVRLATDIKVKLYHQSTSDDIELGKEGWVFFRKMHAVDLATGRSVLSEEMLQDMAAKQQKISDYYDSMGIDYILVMTPAKTVIYPEFIASADCGIRDTWCDQLEAYLKEHTTVNVVNTKHALLENKSSGGGQKLYLKTDSHWTQLGGYVAYQGIAGGLSQMGYPMKQFDVEMTEGSQKGEFSALLGDVNLFEPESVPFVDWDKTSEAVESGQLFDTLQQINSTDKEARPYPIVLMENEAAENGTVLIYGDSQWMTMRQIPQLLGESFERVISTRFRSINTKLDEASHPDVVIFGVGERHTDFILTRVSNIPAVVDALPELPERNKITEGDYGQWIGRNGIWLDTCNDKVLEGNSVIPMDLDASSVKIVGWAADFWNDAPFSDLYLQVGDMLMRCDYNIERISVANHFHKDSLLKTGFQVIFPSSYLKDGEITEMYIIGVSADGQYLYEPVTYQLEYKMSR